MTDIKTVVQNYLHEKTQYSEARNAFYLTAKRIGKLTKPGRLDFGGSEYQKAPIEWLDPVKHSADDKYGWWDLPEGSYWVVYNEAISLTDNQKVFFQPWERAVEAGLTHPSGIINEPREVLGTIITAGPSGVSIKENGRISEVFPL
ncbi:MAG: hypothetical protein ACLFR1_02890 [Spirochaetia bacterium]